VGHREYGVKVCAGLSSFRIGPNDGLLLRR
jgi:hypothetical protein